MGKKVILSSFYYTGDHIIQQVFQNACAIRRVFGAISLFITFTANPKWPKVVSYIYSYKDAIDRPKNIIRVFYIKQRALLEEIRGKDNRDSCFGRYNAII